MEENKFKRIEYTPMRKAISNAMHSSLNNHAQLTMGMTIDATNIFNVRGTIKYKVENEGFVDSSINDIIIYVISRVLIENKYINGHVGEGYFDQYDVVNLAFAVDTPKGLFTPVIFNASEKSLSEITIDSKELINKAMDGKLRLKEMQGGTFTITNLGRSGVQFFTPIINPPQAGILGIGTPIDRLKLVDGNVFEYPEITLSLTMDHGPNDGVAGATFIKAVADALENVDTSIIK